MKHYILLFLIVWVVFGTAIIIYYQQIDGTWNPPITFKVDVNKLKTDKAVYHVGDTVSVYFSFCRHRPFSATTQWRLINDIEIPFAPSSFILPVECLDKYVTVGTIPPSVVLGMHHLEGTTGAEINPLRVKYYNYKTADFNIVK
jgi:hypothetical protein